MINVAEEAQKTAELIRASSHSINLERYMEKRLPIRYPNKGLQYMAKKGAVVEVYHERFDLASFLESVAGQTVETVIDYYGSTHQRDYCLVILGHRFQGEQIVQFRGVLGQNRLYKIFLLLNLAGIPSSQIVFYDRQPNYRTIIDHDIDTLNNNVDHVVFGGDVIIKPFLSPRFTHLSSARGEIVSWSVFHYEKMRILLTSYPYGDLSKYVVEALASKVEKTITFIGSAGALASVFPVGAIILPVNIYDDVASLVTSNFPNYLLAQAEMVKAKISDKHMSVKTPLIETTDMLSMLMSQGYKSIDVEVAHFQRGCERCLPIRVMAGVMLFVSDQVYSEDLSKHDYSSEKSFNIRRRFAQIVESIWEDTI